MRSVLEIPIAHTPPGGYGQADAPRYGRTMPEPILAGCTEPLAPGAPDLRGTWRVVEVRADGELLPAESELWNHVERIEQAGSRLVVTSGGVLHDMICDGTFEHGVHDVMALDFTTAVTVAASYEDGVHVLRPEGVDGVEVRRWREDDQLVWAYAAAFTARLATVAPASPRLSPPGPRRGPG
jgi:hypothetical protein